MPRWIIPGYLAFLALALLCLNGATSDLGERIAGGAVLLLMVGGAIFTLTRLDKKDRR